MSAALSYNFSQEKLAMNVMKSKIDRVAIFGGTHGNESTGVYLIQKFKSFPDRIRRSSFETLTFLANPKAIEARRRYIDLDLNRCFSLRDLENPDLVAYEQLLARSIYRQIKTDRINFLIDLHSTTSNMGLTLLVDNDCPFNLRLAAYLVSRNSEVIILQTEGSQDKNRLRNICDLSLTIEVGGVAQGILDATLFYKTENLILEILDYLEKYNREIEISYPQDLELYSYWQTVNYPRDEEGGVAAMIHPWLQGRDYLPLNEGDPLFIRFDGTEIFYQGQNTVYPVFINESAYWEKNIAMSLTQKKKVSIESLD